MKTNLVIYNVRQVAELFGVDEWTVREWANNGILTASKVGRSWYFEEKIILDKLKENRAKGGEA